MIKDIIIILFFGIMFLYRHLWKKSRKELREIEEDRDYWKVAAGY